MLAPRHPRHRFALPGLVALFAFALVVLESCSPGVPSPSVSPAVAPRAAGVDAAAAGTVKIHDGNSESEGPANDPKVCQFHIHFFLGAGTSGAWRVDTQPGGQTVLKGAWKSGTQPDVRVPPYPDLHTLPDGQYKLFWSQDGQPGGDKQKVFKVDCSGASTPPKPSASASPSVPASTAPAPSAPPSGQPGESGPPSDSPAPSANPSQSDDPSVAPSESADPTVAPEVTSTPGATMAPGPTTTASAPPSARPSGSVEPEATASSSPSPAPSHSVGADRTAKPTTAPDTSTAPATPGAHDLDGTTLLLLVLTALAAAALAVPLPARRR